MAPDEVALPLLYRLVGPLPLSFCARTVLMCEPSTGG